MIDLESDDLEMALRLQQQLGVTDATLIDTVIEGLKQKQAIDATKAHLQAAYLNGFIQAARQRVAAIVENVTTDEQAAEVMPAVTRIYEQVEKAGAQLEGLGYG